ncbi:MAG: prepilin-type N-terminal cleavage/methylation domain-containing protein [Muribaculaceae bacterium]|nr:prepilin-type N-terminal cleavage/methylation domain-containing protein [Muribaculaceae bacterium]
MKFCGFTLAEVLITLGIIGIIAALTIPNLIQNYQQKKSINTWKKAYATFTQVAKQISYDYDVDTFEQAVRLQETEDGLKPNGVEVTQSVINLFSKYFKNINASCNGDCKFGNRKISGWKCDGILAKYVGSKTDYKYLNGKDAGFWILGYYRTACFQTPDYVFAIDTNTTGFGRISVDTNGKYPPNTIGKDIFTLNMQNLNNVIPAGAGTYYSNSQYACDENATYGGPACSKKYLEKY